MVTQSVVFPMPFGRMEFISLTEPDGETEEEFLFMHRLYLVTQFAEGGKILIAQRRGRPMRKDILSAWAEKA